MHEVIKWTVFVTEYCAFFIGFLTLKKHTPAFRFFFYDLVLGLINETTGLTLYFIFNVKNNLWSNNIYVVAETWLMGMACYRLIANRYIRQLIPWLLTAFTCQLIVHIWQHGIRESPVVSLLISNIILACLFLIVMLQLVNTQRIGREPLFWMSIGLIIYYGCSIPYWGVFNHLLKHDLPMLQKLAMLFWSINIFRYGLTCFSFLLLPKKTLPGVQPV